MDTRINTTTIPGTEPIIVGGAKDTGSAIFGGTREWMVREERM